MGLTAVVGAVIFGTGIAAQVVSDKFKGGMKDELFDTFFNVDEAYKKAATDWEKEHGRKLSDSGKTKLKEQLRRRMAAELGFNSPHHAAGAIAGVYAQYMLQHAMKDDDEKKDMCIAMIKGLGLKFKKEKGVPTVADIIKKMVA